MLLPLLMNLGFAGGTAATPAQAIDVAVTSMARYDTSLASEASADVAITDEPDT